MIYRFFLLLFLLPISHEISIAQQSSSTVRGIVLDKSSNAPIPYANIMVLRTNPTIGAVTDDAGNFTIKDVPLGRQEIQVSLVGYESTIIKEVQVSSAKETFINVYLKESSVVLGDITIKPNVSKEQPLNNMATVSARMLSVDEASRYAGGFDDPARLAASFAGVASNVGNNGIVVRGNSPRSLQWKMEGVEIPNPNHFADLAAFGGGGLTALSTKMLANSDFFTGAFPAEYGNALSGVFDIYMRNGNNRKREHSIQIGVIGVEAASEGPFRKEKNSSYLFNYRYSTLGLLSPILPENGGGTTYQDLSFKMNFPTKKAGTFSFWGIGLIDGSGQKEKADSSKWMYDSDREKQKVKQYMGASGLSHTIFLKNNIYLKTTLAATVTGLNLTSERLNASLLLKPNSKIKTQNWNFVLSSFVNTKVSSRHTNRTGIVLTGLMYEMFLQRTLSEGMAPQTVVDENGFCMLVSAYTNSTVNLRENLTMNLGMNAQLFTLNKHFTIEPRIGFKWQIHPSHALGFAYGLHSRLERMNYYFASDVNGFQPNKNLDFTKSHHIVLSYDVNITDNTHIRVEPYLQVLYNVPVMADSSFSFINLQNDWFFNQKLENTGAGRNVGLDITLEQFLNKGFYYMFTASVFDSKYRGGDGVWRDTRYNRNYLLNFLVGKEWQFGKKKQQTFGLNVRFCYQGGDRYTPISEKESIVERQVILDERQAFSKQFPSTFTSHVTLSYKINKRKTAHEIALKMINVTMLKEFTGFQYNYVNQRVDAQREAIFIPNISYRIEF